MINHVERKHKIVLHGSLRKFGPVYKILASSPAQVIRALIVQIPGFAEAIESGMFRIVLGKSVRTGFQYDMEDMHPKGSFNWELGGSSTIHLIPVPQGAKEGGGVGKIIIGAVLMVAAIALSWTPAGAPLGAAGASTMGAAGAATASGSFALGSTAFTVAGASITYGSIAMFGAALMFSGVASMMAGSATSNYGDRDSPDQRASFLFNGPVNVTEQGNSIPLVYGRFRTGSVVASSGLTVEQI